LRLVSGHLSTSFILYMLPFPIQVNHL